MRRAVESSQNVPFVEILEKLEIKNSIKYMKKMGITTLTKDDENPSLALGGLVNGISTLQMAGAYGAIANDGVYIEPTFYTEVLRKSGKRLVKTKQKEKKVMSKESSYVLKQLLKQPVEGANGTATYCKIDGVDVAAKTGTTDENYDRWLCGFTPYYTATCWFGFDQNETINFNKRNPAGLIWANVMARIHSGKGMAVFEMPRKVETAVICKETGKVATTGCSDTYTEFFVKGTVPGVCDKHSGSKITYTNTQTSSPSGTIKVQTEEIDKEEPARDIVVVEEKKENKQADDEGENNPSTTPTLTAVPTPTPTATPTPTPSGTPVPTVQTSDEKENDNVENVIQGNMIDNEGGEEKGSDYKEESEN